MVDSAYRRVRGVSDDEALTEAAEATVVWIGALVIALYRLETGRCNGNKSRNDMPTGRSSDPE